MKELENPLDAWITIDCPRCRGKGYVRINGYGRPDSREEFCVPCGGRGYVIREKGEPNESSAEVKRGHD